MLHCSIRHDGRLLFALTQLRLAEILDTDALDQVELGFEIVDVLFLGLEVGLEELARAEIAVGLRSVWLMSPCSAMVASPRPR